MPGRVADGPDPRGELVANTTVAYFDIREAGAQLKFAVVESEFPLNDN